MAAPIYDLATLGWSGGAIWKTRAHALKHVRPGHAVLVPGAGTGRLALEAAKLGAHTTALDHSPAMFARAERRVERYLKQRPGGASDSANDFPLELRQQSLEDLALPAGFNGFDVVVAEHFLNVFDRDAMPAVRERLLALTRPGGVLAIADFRPLHPGGSRVGRAVQSFHHVVPLGGCALLTRNAMHPIYDHGADLAGRDDVRLEASTDERSFWIGPRWFRAWVFRKLETSP